MLSGQKADGSSADEFSRPFGKGRNGFVLSEGSYVVILEELESAKARGANIYAEVAGHGSLYIGSRNFTKEQKIDKSARTMTAALELSDLNTEDVGFICAAANSSPETDEIEAGALHKSGINARVAAPKSITGESYGASGAMQVAVSALALKEQSIPPAIGDYQIDPALDIDVIRSQTPPRTDSALINSLDPQGNCSCLVLRGSV
jgi:3-oxoacyl-[acyl-carrier-protein] synthase II